MANIVILNSVAHRDLRILTGPRASGADRRRFVPTIVKEFSLLAAHYPILLSKDADTGAFFCGVMRGFDPEENLFLSSSADPDVYRPLNVQRGPFAASGGEIAVDLDDPAVGAADGQALFTAYGAATPYLESITALMRDLQPGVEMTNLFINRLLVLKLLEPIEINLKFDDGEARHLTGLYTVNQEALRELDDDVVVELFRRGYLQLIYYMIGSLKHIPTLARMRNRNLLQASSALVDQFG